MSSSSKLNPDILHEIMSRVSFSTLGRCRAVSRGWNRLTYEPSLASLRSERAGTLHGFMDLSKRTFVPSDSNGDVVPQVVSLEFLGPGPLAIVSAHVGILLCWRGSHEQGDFYRASDHVVCKPTTQQWVVIPKPPAGRFTVTIDLVVLRLQPSLRFKILRISRKGSIFWWEIFDSETWEWKEPQDMNLPRENYIGYLCNTVTVSCTICVLTTAQDSVLMFDVIGETWTIMPLPFVNDGEEYPRKSVELVKDKGILGVFLHCCYGKQRELWMMEDRRNNVWRKRWSYSAKGFTMKDKKKAMRDIVIMRSGGSVDLIPFECDFEPTDLKH